LAEAGLLGGPCKDDGFVGLLVLRERCWYGKLIAALAVSTADHIVEQARSTDVDMGLESRMAKGE
jgi:hypothetical protein